MTRFRASGNSGQVVWSLHRSLRLLRDVIEIDFVQFKRAQPKSLIDSLDDSVPEGTAPAFPGTTADTPESLQALATRMNAEGSHLMSALAARCPRSANWTCRSLARCFCPAVHGWKCGVHLRTKEMA